MSFLLKIVEGPNKGAEIALVEDVAVTLGKGDECDIVLADPTMPDEPVVLRATSGGVTVGDEPVEPFHVKTLGATSFAVGPSDAPWGELVWPKPAEDEAAQGGAEEHGDGEKSPSEEKSEPVDDGRGDSEPSQGKKKRGGCCGCFVVLLVLSLVLAGLAWFFRDRLEETGYLDRIRDSRWVEKVVAISKDGYARTSELIATWRAQEPPPSASIPAPTLSDIAAKYCLSLSEDGGLAKISGNLKTRRERLTATAEAYSIQSGIELDLSDDESFRASSEDALFTLTEGALKVADATNRFLRVVGRSSSRASLEKTLKALNADMPKLRGVDVSGVQVGGTEKGHETVDGRLEDGSPAPLASRRTPKKSSEPSFPVCGILTTPYPCLVLRDGRRIMEGASMGGSVIVEIGADSVTLTNSTGRFTWRP